MPFIIILLVSHHLSSYRKLFLSLICMSVFSLDIFHKATLWVRVKSETFHRKLARPFKLNCDEKNIVKQDLILEPNTGNNKYDN